MHITYVIIFINVTMKFKIQLCNNIFSLESTRPLFVGYKRKPVNNNCRVYCKLKQN